MSLKETREGEREGPREGHTCLDSSSPPGNPRNEVKASDRRVVSSYVVRNVDAVAALFPRPSLEAFRISIANTPDQVAFYTGRSEGAALFCHLFRNLLYF